MAESKKPNGDSSGRLTEGTQGGKVQGGYTGPTNQNKDNTGQLPRGGSGESKPKGK